MNLAAEELEEAFYCCIVEVVINGGSICELLMRATADELIAQLYS